MVLILNISKVIRESMLWVALVVVLEHKDVTARSPQSLSPSQMEQMKYHNPMS